MAQRVICSMQQLGIACLGLFMVAAARGTDESKHLELTVKLIQTQAGTPVAKTRIELWTTDDPPGQGLHNSQFHSQQQTDDTGIARFTLPLPSQRYLIFNGDFDSCPGRNGLAISEIISSGTVTENTCARKKDAIHPQDIRLRPGELVILTLKPTRWHW